MNAYETQPIRKRHKITWQEEYILGMINVEAPLGTMAILNIADIQGVMSSATTHKYLKKLVAKKLVSERSDRVDGRGLVFTNNAKGEALLKEIKDAYK